MLVSTTQEQFMFYLTMFYSVPSSDDPFSGATTLLHLPQVMSADVLDDVLSRRHATLPLQEVLPGILLTHFRVWLF